MKCPECEEEMFTTNNRPPLLSGIPENVLIHKCPRECGVWIPIINKKSNPSPKQETLKT
jgi:hypothetical protein